MNDGAQVIPEAINRNAIYNLADFVVRLAASEVVLALEERRNALPLGDLLRIKTTGVHVHEISTFLERETDRKSVVSGKSVSVRVDLGGRRSIQKKHSHLSSTPTF